MFADKGALRALPKFPAFASTALAPWADDLRAEVEQGHAGVLPLGGLLREP